jgi:hypothetical protein
MFYCTLFFLLSIFTSFLSSSSLLYVYFHVFIVLFYSKALFHSISFWHTYFSFLFIYFTSLLPRSCMIVSPDHYSCSFIRTTLFLTPSPWRWRQHACPKRLYLFTKLDYAPSQPIRVNITVTAEFSKVTIFPLCDFFLTSAIAFSIWKLLLLALIIL